MLGFKDKKFISLPETNLKANNLQERKDIQEAIVGSWQSFTKEIQMPDLQLIGEEVVLDDRIKNRIDILAFDPNDNIPVVIELKRDGNKLQLLQGVSYAAMISSWGPEKFIEEAKNKNSPDLDEITSSLSDLEGNVRIIMIAEKFDPEVIIAANWLYEQFNMDIAAISIKTFKVKEGLYFSFEQKYPLAELHESYELRGTKRTSERTEKTWEDVIPTFKYEWGEQLLQRCRREKEGDPKNKRILKFRSEIDGIRRISLMFRINFVNVYMVGNPDNIEDLIQSKFRESIELSSWRKGYSFHITTQSQYEDLCSWLDIKKVA